MGKFTDALKKAAEGHISRLEKIDGISEVKYEVVVKKVVNSNIDPRIISFHEPCSSVGEQYSMLRTNIQSIKSTKSLKTITITSSIHGEGKSITAVNLAITLARDLSKKSVLLVDADLRRPKIHKYLGMNAHAGLSELIASNANPDECLLDIGIENLTVLTAGKTPQNPAELLGSNNMKNLIDYLKTRYDYIIFDAPPVSPVTDAVILGAETDGVIMVVQATRTQQGVVKNCENILKQAHAKIVGCIVTNIQYHVPEYIYRYL